MNPYLAASLAVLEEMYDALAALIAPLGEDCLTWTPTTEDTNSIAVLSVHIAGSVNSWLARALAEPFERDRDAEFVARRAATELVALIAHSRALAREQFARVDALDGGLVRRVRRLAPDQDAEYSVAWCIEHALIHAGEHWGQIQLNVQLYASQGL